MLIYDISLLLLNIHKVFEGLKYLFTKSPTRSRTAQRLIFSISTSKGNIAEKNALYFFQNLHYDLVII